MVLETGPFDMRRLVEHVLDRFAVLAEHKGLVLALRYLGGTAHQVEGDAERLRELVHILVGHALESTEHGHVLVTIRRHPTTEDSVPFSFEIKDTSSGLGPNPPEDSELATARAHVEHLGGTLALHEAPDGSTTLSFTLEMVPAPPHMKSTQPILQFELENRRVLVVDAHALERQVVRETLERWRFRVTESTSASEAMSALEAAAAEGDPFALAVVAHPLPDGDILTLCRRIKGDATVRDTVLLSLGSASTRPGADALRDAGCSAYLVKPVHQSGLMNGIVDAWAAASAPPPASPPPSSTSKEFGEQNLHVLVVEDNVVNQKVAQHMLIEIGCKVDIASNGREALERTATIAYDLVFMDIQMPEMDGLESIRAIRERDGDRVHIPVVAMTAHARPDDRRQCVDAGMDGYISKPVRQADLRQAVLDFVVTPGVPTDVQSRPTPSTGIDINTTLPCDLTWLRGNYNTDEHVLLALVRMFLERAEVLVSQMREAVDAGDMETLGHHAHALKGISGTVRANPLFVLMVEDPPTLVATMGEIERTFGELREFLTRELSLG